ncbi:MAG: YceI family protein [Balneolales bacterium]|nr:YceI family protein [Balneolales bacterium]
MKKLFTIFALAAISVVSIAAVKMEAPTWDIDKSHSAVNFEIRHFFTPVNGSFADYDATIKFDPENLAESSLDVTIQVASVDTDNDRRDGHLRSPDFFEAETFPTITFSSESITSTAENEFVAKGELTIKDVTTEFELPFTLLGVMDHPWQENVVLAGFTSEFALLRNDFGVGTGDWVSDAVVGNEVKVVLNLEVTTEK